MLFLRNQPADLARYLPKFLMSDDSFQKTLDSCSKEHESYRLLLDDLTNQFYINTATWGLADWERILALKPSATDDYEKRRKRILLYLQSHQISTVSYLEGLADRYITNGTTHITEHNEGSFFNIFINSGDLKSLRVDREGLHEAIDLYKPAHLDYKLIAIPGRRFALNRCGKPVIVNIPGESWTETQHHIIFNNGLNAAGETEIVSHATSTTTQHKSYVFGAGTTNGRLKLNRAGDFSQHERDIGGDVTESWLVFTGGRTNSRASPQLNDTPTKQESRTYHVADWQQVISFHGEALNAAGGGKEKSWTTTETHTTAERRFKRPAPYYALNKAGNVTITRKDVGEDVEIQEIIFTGGTLNGGTPQHRHEQSTTTKATRYVVFTAAWRLNAKKAPTMNCSPSEARTESRTIQTEKSYVTFTGGTLNGGLTNNRAAHSTRTHVVHIPKWRDVIKRGGATTLNAVKHHTTTVEIKHSTPGRIEKKLSPKRGTLLNNHAVLGYMKL